MVDASGEGCLLAKPCLERQVALLWGAAFPAFLCPRQRQPHLESGRIVLTLERGEIYLKTLSSHGNPALTGESVSGEPYLFFFFFDPLYFLISKLRNTTIKMRTCGSIFLESIYDESPYIPFICSVFKGETIGCPAWAFISQRP